ncbi:MAG: glycosyltransferase, partial [Endomicrobia bacterium]|nr:glycosyltransferase [Endomicrobiia bacterium]
QVWDINTAKNVNYFIANSNNVKERIKRIYNRDAVVIYPPVDTDFFNLSTNSYLLTSTYYLVVSAFAPYKKVDIVIEAFKKLRYNLKVVGSGQQEDYLKSLAKGYPNIEFLGWQDNESLRYYYQNAKALIFPTEEDFGIVPVEAQACGCPVIAYGKGGAKETVVDGETGIFFDRQDANSLIDALFRFEKVKFDRNVIRNNALRFSKENFLERFKSFVENFLYN